MYILLLLGCILYMFYKNRLNYIIQHALIIKYGNKYFQYFFHKSITLIGDLEVFILACVQISWWYESCFWDRLGCDGSYANNVSLGTNMEKLYVCIDV